MHGSSRVHRLAPHCKIVGALLFVVLVSLTSRELFGAFAIYALALGVIAKVAGVPIRFVLRRLLVEVPFLLFLVLLPFIGGGETRSLLGVEVSVEGLWIVWNVAIKATLGLATMIVVGATTPVTELLRGLERLRAPRIITAIAGFMVRYADVVTGEMRRMKIAREARGYDPRWVWQAKALSYSAGSLFIRSFERGERVYTAMLSRGFDGSLPTTVEFRSSTPADWLVSLSLPLVAALSIAIGSLVT